MSRIALLKMADAIRDDLRMAVAQHAVFLPTGKDQSLIDRVNRLPKGASFAFNVLSETMHLGLIGTLCRMWDKPRDAAHIPNLATMLKAEPLLVTDRAALTAWLTRVKEMEAFEPLVTLRGFRHVGLAHRTDPNRPDPRSLKTPRGRRVVYGDERKVLEATIEVMAEFDGMLGVPVDPDADVQSPNSWGAYAEGFWRHVGE